MAVSADSLRQPTTNGISTAIEATKKRKNCCKSDLCDSPLLNILNMLYEIANKATHNITEVSIGVIRNDIIEDVFFLIPL